MSRAVLAGIAWAEYLGCMGKTRRRQTELRAEGLWEDSTEDSLLENMKVAIRHLEDNYWVDSRSIDVDKLLIFASGLADLVIRWWVPVADNPIGVDPILHLPAPILAKTCIISRPSP
jgi:hypothetical protein